jgi:hypothetical protein
MIWVRKTEEEYGNYVDDEGNRYVIEWCHKLITPDGSTEADRGYEQHDSVEAACEAWGLIPYVDPEAAMEMEMATIEEKENN